MRMFFSNLEDSHCSLVVSPLFTFLRKQKLNISLIKSVLTDQNSYPSLSFLGVTRLDDQIFINRNPGVPSVVKFHPFNPCIAVADKDSIW